MEWVNLLRFSEGNQTFSLSFQVSGLLGSNLRVTQGRDEIVVAQDGSYRFGLRFRSGEGYSVVVSQQPVNPDQVCRVEGGQGIFQSGDVSTVQIICDGSLVAVSGTVSGLVGSGLQIANTTSNGTQVIGVNSTSFAFPPQISNSTYSLAIASQPTNPWQTCSFQDPGSVSGTIGDSGHTVSILCVTQELPITLQTVGIGPVGTLAIGSELEVQLSPSLEILKITGDGSLSFQTPLLSGTSYSITILNPLGAIATGFCSVGIPSGIVGGSTPIHFINCSGNPTVRGSVANPGGVSTVLGGGGILELSHAGGGTPFATQTANITAGTLNFQFPDPIPIGSEFLVQIIAHPAGPSQTCQISGTGANTPVVISGNVTDLVLDCNLPSPVVLTGSGTFNNAVDVAFDPVSVAGATFQYTLGDGSGSHLDPSCISGNSTTNTVPITNTQLNTIKILQCASGWLPSSVVTVGSYFVKVANPVPSTATGTSMDSGTSVSFSTATTGATWFCHSPAIDPGIPADPVCGASANTCSTGTLGNFSHPGSSDYAVKVVGCRENFQSSDVVSLSYPVNSYSVSGNVSGLVTPFQASSFVLQLNGADDTIVSDNGSFSFSIPVASGSAYTVSVLSYPQAPVHNCTLSNESGSMGGSAVTNVGVSCSVNMVNLVGSVTGPTAGNLNPGTSIELNTGSGTVTLNPGESLSVAIGQGLPYDLSITSQPTGQYCVFLNPSLTQGTTTGTDTVGLDLNCVNGQLVGGNRIQRTPIHRHWLHAFQGRVEPGVGDNTTGYVNGSPGTARFQNPRSIAFAGDHFYIADSANFRIRRVGLDGIVSDFAGNGVSAVVDGVGTAASFDSPHGLATDGTFLYVTEYSGRIRRIHLATAQVTTIAGTATAGYLDGPANTAQFLGSYGLAIQDHNLYIAETGNHRIRLLNLKTNQVTTLAGNGTASNADGVGTAASIAGPVEMVLLNNSLYVASNAGNTIRKIDLGTLEVTTVAGSPAGTGYFADGLGMGAGILSPHGLTTDGVDLYFGGLDSRLRRIDLATNRVTTILGNGVNGYVQGVGTHAQVRDIFGLVSDGLNLYFTEAHGIRKVMNNQLHYHYPLLGNVQDFSSEGNRTDGTWTGTASYGAGRFGEANGAVNLTGTNHIETKVGALGQINHDKSFTISTWIRPSTVSSNQAIFGNSGWVANLSIRTGGNVRFITWEGGNTKFYVGTANIVQPNQWIHLAVVFDRFRHQAGNYGGEIFINGKNVTTISADSRPAFNNSVNANPMRIGGGIYDASNFVGRIADFRFYGRALSAGEIQELARDADSGVVGTTMSGGPIGLLVHHDLEESQAVDKGSLGYNLTATIGAPTLSRGKDGKLNGGLRTRFGSLVSPAGVHGLPRGRADRTTCVWVRPEKLPADGTEWFSAFSYGNDTAGQGFGMGLSRAGTTQELAVFTSGTSYHRAYQLPLHQWTHICSTFNGTDLAIYANGKMVGGLLAAPALNTMGTPGSAQLHLGSWFGNLTRSFPGVVDDLRIYDRLLSPMQIRELSIQIPRGILANYDLNGNSDDSSGWKMHLTNFGGVSPAVDRHGMVDGAMHFNGTTNYLQIASPTVPLPIGTSSVTLCAWVRADQAITGLRSAVSYGSMANASLWLGGRSFDTAFPRAETCTLGTTCTANPYFSLYVWNHLCVAKNSTQAKLFLNGREVRADNSSLWNLEGSPLQIGRLGTQYHFPGQIDDVMVYNRELAPEEMIALSGYHAIQTSAWNSILASSRLKVHFQADNLSFLTTNGLPINEWHDNSGNGNHVVSGTEPAYKLESVGGKQAVNFTRAALQFLTQVTTVGLGSSEYSLFSVYRPFEVGIQHHYFTIGSSCAPHDKSFGVNAANQILGTTCSILDSPGGNAPLVNASDDILFSHTYMFGINGSYTASRGGYSTIQTVPATAYSGGTELILGNRPSGAGQFFSGDLSEVLYFDISLTPDDRRIVECYLSSKYRLPLVDAIECN